MLFGRIKISLAIVAVSTLFAIACNNKMANYITFKQPLQGESFSSGEMITVALDIPESTAVNSITYLVDGTEFARKSSKDSVKLSTQNLRLGYRQITAIVKAAEKVDTISSNIILKTNKNPIKLSYSLVNTFPHDTSSYTQGLSFVNGKLLESTGRKGLSKILWVDLNSGKALKEVSLAAEYFGEGSVKVGDKIVVLTWQENVGLVYDANTLKQLSSFNYQNSREGWGLTFDGKQLLRSDGSNRIWLMNAENYTEESYIEVYDNKGAVESLNELEYIDGKLFANVYGTNKIIVIDPKSGAVLAELDLSKLVPKQYQKDDFNSANNVLNGIAYDAVSKRLFVTGKKWPSLFEIKISGW